MCTMVLLPDIHYCLQAQPVLNPPPLSLPQMGDPVKQLGREKGKLLLYPHLRDPLIWWQLGVTAEKKNRLEAGCAPSIILPLPIVML